MSAPQKLRHAWVRDALVDKGKRQKDLAKLWGVDEAVASRFIRTGEPELTMARAVSLAKMLGMDLLELQARLHEKPIPPRQRDGAAAPAPAARSPGEVTAADMSAVLADLHRAVEAARAVGFRVHLSIGMGDEMSDSPGPGRVMRVGTLQQEGCR